MAKIRTWFRAWVLRLLRACKAMISSSAATTCMATAKHFAVHGQPEGGTNTAPGNYSERIIRENFFVPFQAAVQEARVGSVMASYNEIDGVPSHINHWLLDRVLRQEWGFPGYITSDGDGLQMLVATHHVAYNNADAARQGIAAGIDYDLSEGTAFSTLVAQVKARHGAGKRSGPRGCKSAGRQVPPRALRQPVRRSRFYTSAWSTAKSIANSPLKRQARLWCCSRTTRTCCPSTSES
jgi:beta-glucosidase-like glycosyl hydrolase